MNKRFAYTLLGDISCYADCANARQKIRLVGETLKGVVFIPKGRRDLIPPEAKDGNFEEVDVPWGIWALVRFLRARRGQLSGFGYAVSNETTFLKSIVLSLFSGVPIVLFCWDPPGVSVQNRRDIVSRLRIFAMDWLMALAVRYSEGMILNLHPGFLEGRFSKSVQCKIFAFPNGTTINKNLAYAGNGKRVPKRIAVACRVNGNKGCWDIANYFVRLHKRDNAVSLVWVGGGDVEVVSQYLRTSGMPADRIVMPGNLERDEALKYIATASIAINLYPDIPSLRWNYVLKAPEFLSFGLPIVSTDVPGVREYVLNGETGFLVKSGEVDEAVEKTMTLLNDASLYSRMSDSARVHSLKYDWKMINQCIATQINRMIGEGVEA